MCNSLAMQNLIHNPTTYEWVWLNCYMKDSFINRCVKGTLRFSAIAQRLKSSVKKSQAI